MTQDEIIQKTADFLKDKFSEESSGHDWWHMYRTWQLAKSIAQQESGANTFVVELGALLHDIDDWKFNDGDMEVGAKAARDWLSGLGVANDVIEQIEDIIRTVSFKGAKVDSNMSTLEGKIVHDADKLDAMGAIGIARAFAYGGAMHRPMHDPSQNPELHESFEDYKNKGNTATINHFYEKLLLLKDRMYTDAGKAMAKQRHAFMETYLNQFYEEWGARR